jgi:oligopeptide transport system substrate-binding protein
VRSRAAAHPLRGSSRILAAWLGLLVLLVATLSGLVWRFRSANPGVHAAASGVAATALATLRRGNGPEPETLDPQKARSEAALTVLRDAYEGLTAIGVDDAPVLAAADTVAVSATGTTYTFHLRPGGRWSNGEPVVAEDFAAAWRRLVDPATAAQYAEILAPVRGAAAIIQGRAAPDTLGVRADGATLVVELTDPTPYFLSVLAHPATFPINRASLSLQGRGFAKPGVMVSNGAFTVTRWDFGSHLIAVRNRHYWNDRATQLDAVEYYSFADADTELRAFRTGQVDVTAVIPSSQASWVKQHLPQALHVAPQLAVYYLGVNLRKPPFAGAASLRQALSLVIDRERLVQWVTGGGEAPAYTLVPPATRGYAPPLPEYAAWPMSRRIARARQLLLEGGFGAHPPTLELSYNSGELHNRIAVAVAQMWKDALGLETTLRAEEFKVLLQDIDRGDVGLFRASWIADYDDAFGFLQLMQSRFGINLPHYANFAYDESLRRAARESDPERRRALLQDAEAAMLADQPVIPLYFYVSNHLVAAGVRGWQVNALNIVYSKNVSKVDVALAQ